MLFDNQDLREPENLRDAAYTLGVILHFYCCEFAFLLTGLCIDLELLTINLCGQFCARITAVISAAVEGLLCWVRDDDWEEEADCDPIRVPAGVLWGGGALMTLAALGLLWWDIMLDFGTFLSPPQALATAVFVLPLLLLLAEDASSEELVSPWETSSACHRFRREAARLTSEVERGRD